MAVTRSLTITDKAYQSITAIKGSLSYSDTILKLVTDHNELAKIQPQSAWVTPPS